MGWWRISSRVYPNRASTCALTKTIAPSASAITMASGAASSRLLNLRSASRSERSCSRAAAACLRSVRSSTKEITSSVLPGILADPTITGTRRPSFRRSSFSRSPATPVALS